MSDKNKPNMGTSTQAPAAKPTQVKRQAIRWATWLKGFHGKQFRETGDGGKALVDKDADAMSGYQWEVNLVRTGADGKETVIPIQKDHVPAKNGDGKLMVPTLQRQWLKCLVALRETYGTIKAVGYAHSLAGNFEEDRPWLQKLAQEGAIVEYRYGDPGRATPPQGVAIHLSSLLALLQAALDELTLTESRFPPEKQVVAPKAASVPVHEEVGLVL